jgi:hypothetical protein
MKLRVRAVLEIVKLDELTTLCSRED